jgi:hypothetical protein
MVQKDMPENALVKSQWGVEGGFLKFNFFIKP